ncbi:MAG: IclR family transcriptional regulator, partial [Salinibacterium amurskyense]
MTTTNTSDDRHNGNASKGLAKGIELVQIVADALVTEMSLADLSRAAGMPKPTVHRLATALVDFGLLALSETGAYRLGVRTLTWGTTFLERVDLRDIAKPHLVALAKLSSESVHLGIRERTRVVYIDKIESGQLVRMASRVGSVSPMYCTGIGKIFLAHGDDLVEDVYAENPEQRTEKTITNIDDMRREIEKIRAQGFSVDDVENELGIRCTAAPILNHLGECVAGISIAGPAFRMTVE